MDNQLPRLGYRGRYPAKREFKIRYKISTLLLPTTILGISLAWYLDHRQQVATIRELQSRNDFIEFYEKLVVELNEWGFDAEPSENKNPSYFAFYVSVPSNKTDESCFRAVKSSFEAVNETRFKKIGLSLPSVKTGRHFQFTLRERLPREK